ncbi:hypothetical protein PLESTB_001974700 [Pleodorina starrii]|uniref:Uncharacterized protein n=1 Tax=Pleodorina starrii TaxID=330485 RepID=A0A9W6FB28_9CHLO|nr:hypothetical protein PLESTB_001974700 [Pleodorina starrii]
MSMPQHPVPPGPMEQHTPEPRTELEWGILNQVIATGSLLILGFNYLLFIALIHEGPDYPCISPPSGVDNTPDTMGRGDWSFLPPTLQCHYPAPRPGEPPITVDMFPQGAEIFWASLIAVALTLVVGLILRRRATTSVPQGAGLALLWTGMATASLADMVALVLWVGDGRALIPSVVGLCLVVMGVVGALARKRATSRLTGDPRSHHDLHR